MKILLLGGTGAMGVPLSRILYERGKEVYVTTRNFDGYIDGINFIKGNAHSIDFLARILSCHWDAIVDFLDYFTDEFSERLSILLQSTDHYLFFSSSRVYADSDSPITEESPRLLDVTKDEEFLSTDEYALHKAREENLLIDSGYSNYTIIRPYITYNDYRLQLGVLEKEQWAYRLLKGRTVLFSNDIAKHYTTLTHAKDVAFCLSKLICNPLAFGEVFNITTDQAILWSDVLKLYQNKYKEVSGKTAKIKMIDKALNLANPLRQYQILYDRYYDRRFDNSKIKRVVGGYDFIETTLGLADCFAKFINKPYFKDISLEEEALRNKFTQEHLQLNEINGKKNKAKFLAKRVLGID